MLDGAYYNDSDPFCCAWLSNLMDAGMITPGRIDGRPIQELSPDDIAGFRRVHFFAGIGGWDHALNLAGWGSQPVWTGSCPCQPFSVAGAREGESDKRHLWPEFARIIRICRPPVVFGEQVASPAGLGWLDTVCSDLEGEGYAVGAADLCAAGVGAPHIRQRLYFVAHTLPAGRAEGWSVTGSGSASGCGRAGFVADAERGGGYDGRGRNTGCAATGEGREAAIGSSHRQPAEEHGSAGGLAVPLRPERGAVSQGRANVEYGADAGGEEAAGGCAVGGAIRDFWGAADWLPCRDGKARPVEPGTFPLAYGIPARMGRLRGYGNCIVPQAAAEFIRAYQDCA